MADEGREQAPQCRDGCVWEYGADFCAAYDRPCIAAPKGREPAEDYRRRLYIAVPAEALRLIVSRYCQGDTSVDPASDAAVQALVGCLNRYDDHDGTTWPAVTAPRQQSVR